MALIVITIRDMEDGSCSVQMTDEPRCHPEQTEFSPAQHVTVAALNAIHQQLNAQPNIVDASGAKLGRKKRLITDLDS